MIASIIISIPSADTVAGAGLAGVAGVALIALAGPSTLLLELEAQVQHGWYGDGRRTKSS